MPKKSSYFSNYESPNIVIVPTVNLLVVNKLHDTAAIVANSCSSTSQQNITNNNSNVSLETRGNNLVNYDENVTVSGGIGIVGNSVIDASKHLVILPVFPNEVNIEQEIKSPCTKYHSPKDLTSSKALKAVNAYLGKEQLNNTKEETKSIVNDAVKENNVCLESFVSNNQPADHPSSLLTNSMNTSVKPDKMKGKLKFSNDNDHKNYSHNVLQKKRTSSQKPSGSSSQQPSCSSNKKLEEECTNKDNDMNKYLKQLWTRRIEKMKEKCSDEKHTNDSAKPILKTESSKTSENMERNSKVFNNEPKHELNNYNTLSEIQKKNLTPGALRRYLDYQRFLQNYHKNIKTKPVNNNDTSSKKIRGTTSISKERKEKRKELKKRKSSKSIAPSKQKMKELNEQLTKRIENVKDSEKLSNTGEHINTKKKKKKISSYVEHNNKEKCDEKKNQYEQPIKIKTQSNDGINRKHHVKTERDPNKTEKRNNYLARKQIEEEESKVHRKKSLKRLSTNVAELSDIKRKNKNVNSPLRTSDIRKKITRRNVNKKCDDEMDLRSILSRKRTKSQSHGEPKRFRASTPPRENLIITVKQDIVPITLVNKKTASKARDKKSKKVKLVINISCPNSNSNDSDGSSNECSSPLQDLSFLDDIDIDGIVDSLDVGSANCESNASTKDVFIPNDLYENTLDNTIIEVMKTDSQHNNINDLSVNIEESKERFMVSPHNPDEEICNHSTKTEQNLKSGKTEMIQGKTKVEQVENLCEDTTTNFSPMPINDDVYEVIDITNDTEVIDLSDDQIEKEDEDKLSTTSKKTLEDINDRSIILINDDSKDGMETPYTSENAQDIIQNSANVDDSGVVIIEDCVIDDIESELPEKNHLCTQNCPKSLIKVENTIESKHKLEKLNATVGLNKVNHNTIRKNKSANELQQNKNEHLKNSVDTISRNVKMELKSVLVDNPLSLTENKELSNDASPSKNSVDDKEQLQAPAMKNFCPTIANDKLNVLQCAVLNNPKIGDRRISSIEPDKLNTKTSQNAVNDKLIKTETISEINELQLVVMKNDTKTSGSKISSNGPGNLTTKSPPVVSNNNIKTENTSEINKLQPVVLNNNTKTGNSHIASIEAGNLNTKSPPVVANNSIIKTEEPSEINKLQPSVVKNNIKTGDSKIASNEPANLNTKTSLEATNDKLIKTEAISEQPAVTKNNTNSSASKITSNKPANLNTKSLPAAANDKPHRTEVTSAINKLESVIMKNKTKIIDSKIALNEPANLNTKTPSIAANEKLIKKEATSKISELQPAVIKNNTKIDASKVASNQLANLNTKTSSVAANDKPINVESSKIDELQTGYTKNNTKTAVYKIPLKKPINSNTKTPSVAANDKLIKVEASKIEEPQASNMKNNTKTAVYKIPLNKPNNLNTKISQATTSTASNSIKTENTSHTDECQNNNTNRKNISNTVQNVAKKDNTKKSKNPVVKTENSAQDETTANTQEEDGALALWYMKSIEKRMFDYLHQKYTVMSCLHQGYFSNIYQCKGANGKLYALKVLASRFHSMGMYKDRMLTDLQKSVKDRYHILEIIHNFNFSGEWCFLTEYYPRNLEQALECKTSFHIDLVQILSRQLVAAVSTLTSNQIIHTDIKPAHILLNSTNDHLKLCGFDRSDYNYNVKIIPSFGTSSYRAPEVILGFDANYSIDVWSTALVMHEMATGSKLFPGRYNNDILYKQLSTLGALPFDMVEQSTNAYVHFYGTNFKRQIGNGKWRYEEFNGINGKLRNKLFESYHRDWALNRTSWEVTVDMDKIEMLYRLMEQMLVMDPRHRIPISFAAASEFICDYNIFI